LDEWLLQRFEEVAFGALVDEGSLGAVVESFAVTESSKDLLGLVVGVGDVTARYLDRGHCNGERAGEQEREQGKETHLAR
jgi:hypothetical protein